MAAGLKVTTPRAPRPSPSRADASACFVYRSQSRDQRRRRLSTGRSTTSPRSRPRPQGPGVAVRTITMTSLARRGRPTCTHGTDEVTWFKDPDGKHQSPHWRLGRAGAALARAAKPDCHRLARSCGRAASRRAGRPRETRSVIVERGNPGARVATTDARPRRRSSSSARAAHVARTTVGGRARRGVAVDVAPSWRARMPSLLRWRAQRPSAPAGGGRAPSGSSGGHAVPSWRPYRRGPRRVASRDQSSSLGARKSARPRHIPGSRGGPSLEPARAPSRCPALPISSCPWAPATSRARWPSWFSAPRRAGDAGPRSARLLQREMNPRPSGWPRGLFLAEGSSSSSGGWSSSHERALASSSCA